MLVLKINKTVLVVVYRSSSSSAEFLKRLDNVVEDILDIKAENVYVIGDLNIDINGLPDKLKFTSKATLKKYLCNTLMMTQ